METLYKVIDISNFGDPSVPDIQVMIGLSFEDAAQVRDVRNSCRGNNSRYWATIMPVETKIYKKPEP